jgi:hypothetical protein
MPETVTEFTIARSPRQFLAAAAEDSKKAEEQLERLDAAGALLTMRSVQAELRVVKRLLELGRGLDDESAPF